MKLLPDLSAFKNMTTRINIFISLSVMALFLLNGASIGAFPSAFSQQGVAASIQCGAGYGLTPEGCAALACVHVLGPNEISIASQRDGSVVVSYADGKKTTFPACQNKNPRFATKGWVEDAVYSHLAKAYTGNWAVPQAPSSNVGQTIFIFTATEDNPVTNIIQPVLQWGPSAAGGGAYWTLASWYVTTGGQYLVSQLVNVNAGDKLLGTLQSSSCTKSHYCNWAITGKDLTHPVTTTLKITNEDPQSLFFVTLEVYNVGSCSNYPESGHTTFTHLTLNSGKLTPTWSTHVLQNDGCGEKVTVLSASKVTLYY